MPIVFVHGVKTRPGKKWDEQGKMRRSLFERFALRGLVPDPTAVHYHEPMWGTLAASPRWDNASLPSGRYETFAPDSDEERDVGYALVEAGFEPVLAASENRQLVARTRQIAAEKRGPEDRQALEELLDILIALAADAQHQTGADIDALAEFSARAAEYARANPAPDWLDEIDTDVELINTFADEVEDASDGELAGEPPAPEAFGRIRDARDKLLEAAGRVASVGNRLTGRGFTLAARGPAHRAGAIFLGDILVYLDERGDNNAPGPIITTVADAIAGAAEKVRPDVDPKLIVVAHSLGGEIVYDLLTYFRPELEVDVLVTVGSQVAFFEELGRFRKSSDRPADPKTGRVPRPSNVKRWINVFDLNDVLGFPAGGVFSESEVEDYVYSTGKGALKAHGTYLMLPSFHQRLRERLARW